MGGVWIAVSGGLFLRSANSAAIDPSDPTHLLLGGDSGLLRTRNGGRTWLAEATERVPGPITALQLAADGLTALASSPAGIFRWAGGSWSLVTAPGGAVPARAILAGAAPGEIYLLGRNKIFWSRDGGASFARLEDGLPSAARFTALALASPPAAELLAIVDRRLMLSADRGRTWLDRSATADPHDTVTVDPAVARRVWTAARDRLYRSDDLGRSWQPVGNPFPETQTLVRDIAADPAGRKIIVTGPRGLLRTEDGGQSWTSEIESLPAHQEAGELAQSPSDPALLLVVYSMTPLDEVWRGAIEAADQLSRPDPVRIAGAVVGGMVVLVVAFLLVRRLRPTPAVSMGKLP